jgi:hypothetical protein
LELSQNRVKWSEVLDFRVLLWYLRVFSLLRFLGTFIDYGLDDRAIRGSIPDRGRFFF